jgi:NitT/TauT family transport system ATP-binding protein
MTTAVAAGTRLELDDVRLSYTGAPVVDGLSLTVRPGEILVLTGPSGCGKSTVLRALAGLLRPASGRVLADGHEVTTTSRDRGMVFQDSALLPWRTVRSNIELALQLRGEPRAGRRRRAEHWIDEVGLTGFADYLPKSLSGGMRQRVQLARGLAGAPRAVMMDEPFVALDTQTRAAMQRLLIDTGAPTRRRLCSSPMTSTRHWSSATASPSWAASANPCGRSSTYRSHARTSPDAKRFGQKSLRLWITHDADT